MKVARRSRLGVTRLSQRFNAAQKRTTRDAHKKRRENVNFSIPRLSLCVPFQTHVSTFNVAKVVPVTTEIVTALTDTKAFDVRVSNLLHFLANEYNLRQLVQLG